jgi:dynein heavy chain
MYNYQVDPEIQIAVENLGQKWQDLLDFADKKDFDVIVLKQSYQEITKGDVKQCKKSIQEEYEKYISNGPGSDHVSLDEGLELMAASKEKIKAFNQEREKNVLAEKLFNLPISKYPELIKMEE